ncbi:MAG: tRNA (adenosine(37)-N6)-threonylcarbamoyltransferase complex transferase subunit TsaD [Parcubacteria group bacterium]|jgi:N6-L-threonylcarbamoyladenine synthase
MNILAIETSCDDTAVALVRTEKGSLFVTDSLISSQIKVHAPFGGVVPDLTAREHLKNLPRLLRKIFDRNKITAKDIDLISVTQGPGLIPALLIGTNAAKALAYSWRKPLVGVNHVAGHIYANFIGLKNKIKKDIKFPILALVVSGGHTELIVMKKHMDFKIVGQTLDDAAGEAFDKVAKILGLGYPGGPKIAAYAAKHGTCNAGRRTKDNSYALPRPMIKADNLNFSFSGLKTAVLYTVRDNPKILKDKKLSRELCAEFQQAVIDVLVHKTLKAARKYKPKTVILGGGVSANKELRKQLGKAIKDALPKTKYQMPDAGYSLDNAAMIATLGYYKFNLAKNRKIFESSWRKMEADANLKYK